MESWEGESSISSVHLSVHGDKEHWEDSDDGRTTPTPTNITPSSAYAQEWNENMPSQVKITNNDLENKENGLMGSELEGVPVSVSSTKRNNRNIYVTVPEQNTPFSNGMYDNGDANVSKWLEYVKQIKPRKTKKDSPQSDAENASHVDIHDKYPTLQASKFYRDLYRRYPKAFHRHRTHGNHSHLANGGTESNLSINGSESDSLTPRQGSSHHSPSRRIFNSGLHVHFEDEISDFLENRSVCSELPLSARSNNKLEDDSWRPRRGQGHRTCLTSPTPSLASEASIKQRLNATSRKLRYLLNSASPFQQSCSGHFDYDLPTLVTPRQLGGQCHSRSSRSRTSSTSTLVSYRDDSDFLSTPRYRKMHDTSRQRLAREEKILQLERELELKDIELQGFREQLEIETNWRSQHSKENHFNDSQAHGKNTKTPVLCEDKKETEIHHGNNSFSPPDSAIEMDNDEGSNLSSNDLRPEIPKPSPLENENSNELSTKVGHLDNSSPHVETQQESLQQPIKAEVTEGVEPNEEPDQSQCMCTGGAHSCGQKAAESTDAYKLPSATDSDEDSGIVQSNQDEKGSDHGGERAQQSPEDKAQGQEVIRSEQYQSPDVFSPTFHKSRLFASTPAIHTIVEEELPPFLHPESFLQTSTLGRPRIRSQPNQELEEKHIMGRLSLDSCHHPLMTTTANMAAQHGNHRNKVKDIAPAADDDVDDSDPRYGIIPSVQYNENILREKYLKKRLTFNSNRQCLTARDKVRQNHLQRVKSEDPVSVLCSPRRDPSHQGASVPLDYNQIIGYNLQHGISDPPDYTTAVGYNTNMADVIPEHKLPRTVTTTVDHEPRARAMPQKMLSMEDMRTVGVSNHEAEKLVPIQESSKVLSLSAESINRNNNPAPLSVCPQNISFSCVDLTEAQMVGPKISGPGHMKRKFKLKNVFHFTKKGHFHPPEWLDKFGQDLEVATQFKSMPDLASGSEVKGNIDEHENNQTMLIAKKPFKKPENLLQYQNSNVPKTLSGRTSEHASHGPGGITLPMPKADKGSKHQEQYDMLWNGVENYNKQKYGSESREREKPHRTASVSSEHSQSSKRSCRSSSVQFEEISDHSNRVTPTLATVPTQEDEGTNPSNGPEEPVASTPVETARKITDTDSQHIYAKIDINTKAGRLDKMKGNKLARKLSKSTPDISMATDQAQSEFMEQPPLPDRKYNSMEYSNLIKSKEVSASTKSLNKNSKNPFKALKKAVSMGNNLNKDEVQGLPEVEGQQPVKKKKEKSSKLKALKNLFKKKSKKKNENNDPIAIKQSHDIELTSKDQLPTPYRKVNCQSLESLSNDPTGSKVSGKLTKLNVDGTQVIELRKPEDGPLGIFIARGNSHFKHGIFISRFSDEAQEKAYGGLLSVGDEIKEVNRFVVKDLALDDVYDIMAAKSCLTLRILPLLARTDT